VRACNGNNSLYMILKATINTPQDREVEVDFTSTQSGPPWPCAGDSTHFILRCKKESLLVHGTALMIKELTNTDIQSASPGQRRDVRMETYQKDLIRQYLHLSFNQTIRTTYSTTHRMRCNNTLLSLPLSAKTMRTSVTRGLDPGKSSLLESLDDGLQS